MPGEVTPDAQALLLAWRAGDARAGQMLFRGITRV